jgi:integrase
MSEQPIETVKATRNKVGQETWTYRKLDGKGPNGCKHYIFRYEGKGNRLRKWFTGEEAARAEAKRLNAELLANGNGGQLDSATRLQANRALAILKPYGATLVEAAEAFVAQRKRDENPVYVSTIAEAVKSQYRSKLANREVSKGHFDGICKSLRFLVNAFGSVNAKTLTGAEIKEYIAQNSDWKTVTKHGQFIGWNTAFKAAVELRFIDRNPLDGISNFRVTDKSEVTIIPTDKIKDLIANAPERARAGLVLKLFTGIRTAEVCRLDWSAISLDRGSILIDAKISKTRKTRRIALDGLLSGVVEWLRPYAKAEGLVYGQTASTFAKDVKASAAMIGYQLSENTARHSFCSRHYVAGKNETATVQITGHSVKMLVNNYTHDVSPEDAAAFFALRPKKAA